MSILLTPLGLSLSLPKFGVVLCVVYRPPSNSAQDDVALADYMVELVQSSSREVVFVGDFNLPGIKWNRIDHQSNLRGTERLFFNTITTLGLTQWVKEPTFVYSENTLDLVLTTEPDRILDIKLLPPFPRCGHSLIVVKYVFQHLVQTAPASTTEPRLTKLWRQGDFAAINRELNRIDWGYELSLGDVEHNFDYVTRIIEEAVNYHVPAAPAKPFCPWRPKISKNLKKNKSQTWKDYKLSRRTYGRQDPITILKLSLFTQTNAEIKQNCLDQREEHEERLAVTSKDHPKRLHGYIRSKKVCRPTVGPLLIGNSLSDSPALMANCLSEAFCSVFDDTYPPDLHPHQTSEGSISSVNINRSLVLQRLKKLDTDSCPGPDKVHARILKSCASSLAEPLSLIFDKSLRSSTLPTSWKAATVSPIYKGKGPRSDPLNYRPISLTSIPCKTMERIVAAALTEYFETNNIISPFQFGFRSGRSTTAHLQ